MLVLALQFSKGIAGVGIVHVVVTDTLTRHAVAAELEARAGREGGPIGPAPSKRKRRQRQSIRDREEDGSCDSLS
jgi:hypothetical protein